MTHFQTKPWIFRNEVIGYFHEFDCDIEITTDLSGEITDYSGCGFKQAEKLIQSLNK
tara:strand:- start:918 stop:1088 length:171 start_codon:yes stop_codon:yes gene_type:complete